VTALLFPSEESARFVVTAGLVPEAAFRGGAWTWPAEDGALWLAPDALDRDVANALAAVGVKTARAKRPPHARRIASWLEVFGLRKVPVEELAVVLFELPERASLAPLAGELLRLGCDRLAFGIDEGSTLLRAERPPYYSVLRAVEGDLRAYVPSPRGQERVWTEVGWEHPLASFFVAPGDAIVLVSTRGIRTVEASALTDIYAIVDLALPPGERRALVPVSELPRVIVPLRLARAAAGTPSLWVIREGLWMLERRVASLPDEVVDGLLFAAAESGEILLRARAGSTIELEMDEPYAEHADVAQLFVPLGTALEPPLAAGRIRDLLARDPDEIVWLRRDGGVERMPESAFRPLSELVDYVVEREAPKLVPWIRGSTFAFEAFVGIDATPRDPVPSDAKPARRIDAPRIEPRPRPQEEPRAEAHQPTRSYVNNPAEVPPNEAALALADVERAFVALESPLDAPERTELWKRIALLNEQLGHRHDAALAWARAVWEGADPSTWIEAEERHTPSLATLLALDDPSREHVRAVAVRMLGSVDGSITHDVSLWLDRHEDALDVRTAWLARAALAKLVGGDPLGLARARDRWLAKIHGGLSLERDVPSFMRRVGASRDAAQVELLASKLEALLDRYAKTKRKRSATEADPKLTAAYVQLVVAYGMARLGRGSRAAELAERARRVLPPDPVHEVLAEAYLARIGQVLEGHAAIEPLPAEISAKLAALGKLDRYKADRVRQSSKILEPRERLDPITAYQRGEADPRGSEFADLRGAHDATFIDARIEAILATAATAAPDERARLYDGAMDFFPSLPRDRALASLRALVGRLDDIAHRRRVELLEEALTLAGHFGDASLVASTSAALEAIFVGLDPDTAADVAPLVAVTLRTLRRVGLADEAERLLATLQHASSGRSPKHLVARLHTAAALAFFGDLERARPVFEQALAAADGALPTAERLVLTRALASALGAAPVPYAVAGLDAVQKKLDTVTDNFNTNTHVCVSVVDFMESLVLGYASEELVLDPVAKRLIDEDEYLVRRRIHRDLQTRGRE
jgi:cellulose synthase operon protein C